VLTLKGFTVTVQQNTPLTAQPTQDLDTLRQRFLPIFERIADGAVDRERNRALPFTPVRHLEAAGFATLRIPREFGGDGVSIEALTQLLIELAEADSNVAHLYRSHFGFVESIRFQERSVQEHWYARLLGGQTVGNASTERGGNALGTLNTTLTETSTGYRLNGTKYYTTGSIFSTHTRVSAAVPGKDERRFAVVPIDAQGVSIDDDWDGFGQRLTGSGTAVFTDVEVDAQSVLNRVRGTNEAIHEAAFFQLFLLAVEAGIAKAALRDASGEVSRRTRTFNTGSGSLFREDPLILQSVGQIAAKAYAAEAIVLQSARALDEGVAAVEALRGDDDVTSLNALPLAPEIQRSEVAVEHAQIMVPELAISAAQELFQTLGASATSTSKALDRHWRNAQTVATHNPISFRARAIGDYWVNGVLPEGLNAIGDAAAAKAEATA
jgi:alkylation response protein AidB-like acyl-CoA dehydrogenase